MGAHNSGCRVHEQEKKQRSHLGIMPCFKFCRSVGLGTLGAVLIIIAAVIYPITDIVTISQLEENLSLKAGTLFFKNWVDPAPEVIYQFWLWNIENKDDFNAQGPNGEYVKPKLVQRGPYSYKHKYEKTNIEYQNGEFDTSTWVQYTQMRTYTFDPETSCADCNKDDKVTNINLVAVAVFGIVNNLFYTRPALAARRENETKRCCAKDACKLCLIDNPAPCPPLTCSDPCRLQSAQCTTQTFYESLMLEVNDILNAAGVELVDNTKTVNQLLFGFKDPIFSELAKRLSERDILGQNDDLINTLENLEYGVYKMKQDPDGWEDFVVKSGYGDIMRVAELVQWQNKTDLSPWYGESKINFCNRIEGTDGQSTFPGLTRESRVEIFVPDICRNIYMDFEREYLYKGPDGLSSEIPGYMYRTPESVFQSASNPKNHCYCSPNLPKSPVDWCKELDGFSMIDQCQFGAPAIASAPHFLSASDFFFDKLDGLQPDEAQHVSYVVYEPTSGSIIHNAKRLQVNFLLTPNDQLDFMPLKEAIPMPMFWLNETMKLDAGTTEEMYEKSIKPLKITTSLQYSLFAIGGFLVLISVADGCRTSNQESKKVKTDNGAPRLTDQESAAEATIEEAEM